jgi:lipopolysaccharide biosynthesis regulator YciM
MGAALVLLLVGVGALAAGVLIGRYYVPDDRQLRRTARHSRAYMRALSHLIQRDHDTVVSELRGVVEENVDDVEPYFALGAMFRSKGEHERAIRVHQALALRERDKRKLRQRAMYELGLDFRAAGMPRRATRALEEVLLEEPNHEHALRTLAALYEEQARFNEAANLWQRLGKKRNEDTSVREHHLLVAAAQAALARDDVDSAKQLLKAAQKHQESGHFFAAAAELAAARGNHRGAKDRLKQALVADPALAPHLLPGLIAAEQGIDGNADTKPPDDLADEPVPAALDATPADAEVNAQLPASTETALVKTDTPEGVALVPSERPSTTVADRVLQALTEIEATTGPRLELALIRAQLVPPTDTDGRTALAKELTTRFPEALAARVATARLALHADEAAAVRTALEVLVADQGALAWTLRGRWQCSHCGHRPGPFSWRCGQCRRWGSLRMETGVEPPPVPPRERRAAPRTARPEALLGAAPDEALPAPTLDPGLSEEELARAGTRRSLLGKVGGWLSGAWARSGRR